MNDGRPHPSPAAGTASICRRGPRRRCRAAACRHGRIYATTFVRPGRRQIVVDDPPGNPIELLPTSWRPSSYRSAHSKVMVTAPSHERFFRRHSTPGTARRAAPTPDGVGQEKSHRRRRQTRALADHGATRTPTGDLQRDASKKTQTTGSARTAALGVAVHGGGSRRPETSGQALTPSASAARMGANAGAWPGGSQYDLE